MWKGNKVPKANELARLQRFLRLDGRCACRTNVLAGEAWSESLRPGAVRATRCRGRLFPVASDGGKGRLFLLLSVDLKESRNDNDKRVSEGKSSGSLESSFTGEMEAEGERQGKVRRRGERRGASQGTQAPKSSQLAGRGRSTARRRGGGGRTC